MSRFIIVTSSLILAIIAWNLPLPSEPALTRKSLKEFPSNIGDWVLTKEQRIDEGSMAVLRVDDYIMRTYTNSKGESISLYIGYFKTQREGKSNHSPRQCLPGAGWSLMEASSLMLDVSGGSFRQIPANRYLMQKGNEKELFLFWYQGRGRQLANEYLVKAYLLWDSITRHRTDGALIRINSLVSSSPDKILEKQREFIRSFYPFLSNFVPE